jgi:hypothetical protein
MRGANASSCEYKGVLPTLVKPAAMAKEDKQRGCPSFAAFFVFPLC